MTISGGDILLEAFQSQDVECIFCSPGSEWVAVWENLLKRYDQGEKTLKYVNCRHESLAVSSAIGYAEATGHLPAVLLHTGVGTLHSAMAIRAAYRGRVPMIICSAGTPDHGEDENSKGPGWYWLSQLSGIEGPDALVRSYVKWSNAVTSKETLVDSIYRGCQIAQTPPRGPVFLTVPGELLSKPLPEVSKTRLSSTAVLSEPHPRDLEKVAKLLVESKQPIIITEHAGERSETVGKLVELAELLSIPVFESISPAYANFPKDHPLHMGYDASEALHEADTVFVVGGTTPWYPPSTSPPNEARVIYLDEDHLKEQLPYWGYRIDLSLSGDIGQWLTSLVATIRTYIPEPDRSGSHYQERFTQWQTKHEQMVAQWKTEALAGQRNKPISPKWFLSIVNKVLPSNSIVVAETITHTPLVNRYLTKPDACFRAAGGGLGLGLGMTAGVKLACENRPVIFLVGDGSFNYNPVLAGLGLCQEYHLPVVIIVLNNGGYMAMRGNYQQCYPNGWAVSHNAYLGVDIAPEPDYTKVAEAFDAHGERLAEPDDIEPALNRALQQIAMGKVALLDVILDPRLI
ncbi:thiamine pyrophosphate-dependent enzyme [Chloroflexota bacterium]